ncbi:MAG: hypothetical protein HOQ02_03485 [Lysobacter sp.]|nr:hypothetical protein [Lysobacter sp.]
MSDLLRDAPVPIRLRLAALWTSVMFLYLYADYFGLYIPGRLQSMLAGKMAPLGPVTQGVLLGTSAMMAIPALMVAFSLLLPARSCRWLNIAAGALYTAIILLTMWDWAFFVFYGVLEIALTGSVAWCAWRWPRAAATDAR